MTNQQTPRTDFSEIERISANGRTFVNADFARELEREIIQRNKDFDFICAMKREREDTIHKLRDVLEEIANAAHFDNIGNWARNKAREALKK